MPKLTTIKPPKNTPWPTTGLVQIGTPSPTMRGSVQDVLLDGVTIGRLEGFTHRPFPTVSGARTSREWRIYPGVGRPSYGTRWQALIVIIRDHQESRA
jgi:hypothetical protein